MIELTRVLFICLGNICRSPMAEFVLKDMLQKQGVVDKFYVESAGTSSEERGNPVHYGTRLKLAKEGISCSGKTSRQLCVDDRDKFDWFICMDESNIRAAQHILKLKTTDKLVRLLSFTGDNRNIADPWYTGNFDETYSDILKGCTSFLKQALK